MIKRAGGFFAERFSRWMPDCFVVAILLTMEAFIMGLAISKSAEYSSSS